MIEITGVNLVEFVKKAYELSRPQGLGFLHFNDLPMTDEDAKSIIEPWNNDKYYAVDMDYIRGRSVKMDVVRQGECLFISNTWYDHTPEQLQELLSIVPKQ